LDILIAASPDEEWEVCMCSDTGHDLTADSALGDLRAGELAEPAARCPRPRAYLTCSWTTTRWRISGSPSPGDRWP